MQKPRTKGFTVVELVVVIIVIGILATVTMIAYRETQKNARNDKYRVDGMTLQAAVDDYYAEKGDYPAPVCNHGGNAQECHNGTAWSTLVSEGYLKRVPKPNDTSNYYWRRGSATSYGILVPLEPTPCKISRGNTTGWWSSAPECNFSA